MPEVKDEVTLRIEQLEKDKLYSASVAAHVLGIHRVTLLRMEQQNVIEKAKWKKTPQPHRVYLRDDIAKIKEVMDRRMAERFENVDFIDA